MTAHPQTIAAHMLTTSAPAADAAQRELHRRLDHHQPPDLERRIRNLARNLDHLDLAALAEHLTAQRTIAQGGRPRTGHSGSTHTIGTSTTEAIGTELARIRTLGLDVTEALDRLHPDQGWPALASGQRTRTSTATEHLAEMAAAAWGTLSPAQALDDLHDAVDGIEAAVQQVRQAWHRADQCRAWHSDPAEVDPPPLADLTRCACGQHTAPHHHPDTGSLHHADLCDDCYRLLCPRCHSRQRRTPGAKECQSCADAAQRAKRRAV